ncbi:IS3 family transposase [Bacillus toyonensis]|uniref:IS3 family transposase n=1 Tax=Bacillus toyonensis TaxID=155322 RepID=UPI001145C075|nr:IS3 family transposase [Bacillus toyonensis]
MRELIQAIHVKHKKFDCPRMKIALQEARFLVNLKKVYRLMRELQIQSLIHKKRRFFKGKSPKIFHNIVEQQFRNRKPNEVLVTDITYLSFKDKFLYLSVVQDIYNNEIVAWKLSHRNDLQLVLKKLDLTAQKRAVYGTIIHPNQGFQYTSFAYHHALQQLGAIGSYSRKENCHDNALIGSFHSHLKSEGFYAQNIKQLNNASIIQTVDEYIHYYNNERIQRKLDNMSPIAYRKHVI